MHSHLLPCIDDGAQNPEMSLELLDKELQDGVETICLTPHFNFEQSSVEDFLDRRSRSFELMQQNLGPRRDAVRLLLGAEVAFSPRLAEEKGVERLCVEGTRCMLLELPVTYLPRWTDEVLYELQLQGITPLLAHVERYPYFQSDPGRLAAFIENGAYIQVNTSTLLRHQELRRIVFLMMRHELVHCLGTDAHSPQKRPPTMKEALELIGRKLGVDYAKKLCGYGQALTEGKCPEVSQPRPVKKIFGRLL